MTKLSKEHIAQVLEFMTRAQVEARVANKNAELLLADTLDMLQRQELKLSSDPCYGQGNPALVCVYEKKDSPNPFINTCIFCSGGGDD